jgi:DNA-binding MarR family transcriptional regulator
MVRQAARDEVAVRRFVEQMAVTLTGFGFPRMPARVLVTLMAIEDEEALTAAELGDRLGVSPAAISGAVRYLIQFGLVIREPVPGSRSDRYRLADHAWYEASVAKGQALTALAAAADRGVEPLGGEKTRAGERVAEMRDFFLFCHSEIQGLVDRWRAQRA